MPWVAGVDGCKGGWFRVCRETESGELVCDVIESVGELVERLPRPMVVALDMPIGLSESGSRECDVAARRCLGPRRNSVFPAPIRSALRAASREGASVTTERIDGRRVSAQAWAIYAKIRQVDDAMQAGSGARALLREVHPEVSFWAWSGKRPLRFAKKTKAGLWERSVLAESWLGPGIAAKARASRPKRALADDDVLDAIAALWTAHRIADGRAETLPAVPPLDQTGLRMEIVF